MSIIPNRPLPLLILIAFEYGRFLQTKQRKIPVYKNNARLRELAHLTKPTNFTLFRFAKSELGNVFSNHVRLLQCCQFLGSLVLKSVFRGLCKKIQELSKI